MDAPRRRCPAEAPDAPNGATVLVGSAGSWPDSYAVCNNILRRLLRPRRVFPPAGGRSLVTGLLCRVCVHSMSVAVPPKM